MSARNSIIPLFIPHLGCAHDCVFCNQKHISGALKPVEPGDVKSAVEASLPLCDCPPQLAFYGGSFTAMPMAEQSALLDAAAPYLASGRISGIRLSTRPDAIDAEILNNLRSRGVAVIELGAQSMDDDVLAMSRRGHCSDDTARASELIKSMGFGLVLQMMTGLPGSNAEKDIYTTRRIIGLKPDGVRIYPTVLIRDTELLRLWERGEYCEHSVEAAVELCSVILPMFENAGIPVIRLGLNPTDDLSGGEAVGGAYHPALGELVRSRIYLKKAMALLEGTAEGSNVVLGVNKSAVSQMVGNRRCNISALKNTMKLGEIRVAACDVNPGEIKIISAEKE